MANKWRHGKPDNPESAFNDRLELLRTDHVSPSITLAHQAIDLAEDWLEAGSHPKRLARELSSMHPGLALISNVARMLEEENPSVLASLRMLQRSLERGNRRIAERLAELVAPNPVVITLSNSATVLDALAHLGTRVVYLVDARPGVENDRMIEQLRSGLAHPEREVQVHLIEAATIGNIVPHIDCGVVGIDSISRSGAVLHRVGTLPLALCCHYFKKPFYALGHSLKQLDHELDELPQTNSALETRVFDLTPAELITCITERTGNTAQVAMGQG